MSRGLRALKRIKDFMEANTIHWKQDVGYIEKELRSLEVIKEKFDIEVFEMKDLDGKAEYIIDIRPKPNKHSNISGNFLTKEKYELLKEDPNV